MGLLKNYRRYLHRSRMNAKAMGDGELESVWKYKQEAQPATALPAGFPFASELEAAGYTTREDLDGADLLELKRIAGLSTLDAQAVLDAWLALP